MKRQKRLAAGQRKELTALAQLPDDQIDVSDIPEISDWSKAVVGRFYRPIKKPVTLRIDADVLAWLKRHGSGYQIRINQVLRKAMEGSRSARKTGAQS